MRATSCLFFSLMAALSSGLEVDGIYRVSGNLATIQKLRFIIDQGGPASSATQRNMCQR